MELDVIAIDIAKGVFQLHWVEHDTGSIERLKLKRAQVLTWFANRDPVQVAMEACGGAYEWVASCSSSATKSGACGMDMPLLAQWTASRTRVRAAKR